MNTVTNAVHTNYTFALQGFSALDWQVCLVIVVFLIFTMMYVLRKSDTEPMVKVGRRSIRVIPIALAAIVVVGFGAILIFN